MFRRGDKVVCVNVEDLPQYLQLIKVGEIYTVRWYSEELANMNLEEFYNINYGSQRFVSISEYRKMKLEKLGSL